MARTYRTAAQIAAAQSSLEAYNAKTRAAYYAAQGLPAPAPVAPAAPSPEAADLIAYYERTRCVRSDDSDATFLRVGPLPRLEGE